MKKIIGILCLFLVIATLGFARTEQIVNPKNEYGGKTIMYIFSSGDKPYKEGIAKAVAYYDAKNNMLRTESYYVPDSIKKDGIVSSIDYYDKKEKITRSEFFYNEKSIKDDGVAKSVAYLDGNQKIVKTQMYDTKEKLLFSK
ncbi:MAG: hypothetical protein ACYDHW_12305 [Syntrophorhabdaceae bacterium]